MLEQVGEDVGEAGHVLLRELERATLPRDLDRRVRAVASCTVRTNEAIRSGNVHSALLKNTRTYRGPSASTLAPYPRAPAAGR